jgi:hypothetical protein
MLRATLLAIFLSACTAAATQLFNGDDLAGWYSQGDADWRVDAGEIIGAGAGEGAGDGYLLSREEYANFDLTLEFQIDAETNSGIYIRCQQRDSVGPDTCYEMNIWDLHPQQEARTGAIVFQVMPPLVQVNTLEGWNTYRIRAAGPKLEVWVNGELTAVLEGAEFDTGFIALQRWQSGTVRFRNIQLRKI